MTDSRFIPETLKFNDGSSVVSWFYVDDSGLLSPAYQRFDQFGKKVGESVNLKSINPNSSAQRRKSSFLRVKKVMVLILIILIEETQKGSCLILILLLK